MVKKPNGVTDQFTTQNTVKQGTTFGPITCCAETDRVNEITERVAVMYGPELEIGMPVFMDDIMAVGEAENIRTGIRNCRIMEKRKNLLMEWKKLNTW